MDQNALRCFVAGVIVVLMVLLIGYGVVLRKRGVRIYAVAGQGANAAQRALIAGAALLELYLVLRAPFPALDGIVAARPAPAPGLAIAVILAGAAIMVVSQIGMGKSWRVGVPAGDNHAEALVTGGLHRVSRNPFYLGVMIFLFGVLLAAPGPFTLVTAFISFVGLTITIRREERYLNERFGAQYEAYRKRVRRWI